jgi:hypothetical protein
MIARTLVVAACLVPAAAFAAPAPKNATEFAKLPALGFLVEEGAEKDYRFRTYMVGKKASSTGAIEIYMGQIHMRVQDTSGGKSGAVSVRKWTYAARCSGAANTISIHIQSIVPREKAQHTVQVMPGAQPDNADRTWYNAWYAVCLGETEKYLRRKEE